MLRLIAPTSKNKEKRTLFSLGKLVVRLLSLLTFMGRPNFRDDAKNHEKNYFQL